MEGYQFGNLQSWSRAGKPGAGKTGEMKRRNGERAWPAAQVIDEVERQQGACEHVPEGGPPPVVIPGTCANFEDLRKAHDEACQVKETYLYTNPKTRKKKKRKRKIRKDSRTLYSCVISFPIKSEDALKDPAVFDEASDAIARAVNWQTEKLARAGGEMAKAVAHYDEAQVHVNIFGLDREHGHVRKLHPGMVAHRRIEKAHQLAHLTKSARKALADRAYCDAMRGWQDELYHEVGEKLGPLRFGPGRERLTRAEYNRRKASAKAYAQMMENFASLRPGVKAAQEIEGTAKALLQASEDAANEKTKMAEDNLRRSEAVKSKAETEAIETARFLTEAPESLAAGEVEIVDVNGDLTLRASKSKKEQSFFKPAVLDTAAEAPASVRKPFLRLWSRAQKKATEAAQKAAAIFEPDGLLGPWSDAFRTIKAALLARQDATGDCRDREANDTPFERATMAIAAAAEDADAHLAEDLKTAARKARARRRAAQSSGSNPPSPSRGQPLKGL